MSPLLHRSTLWLVETDALASMAAAIRAADPYCIEFQGFPAAPLLSVDDGVAVVAIDGPIMRKPDVIDRLLFGAVASDEIGAALREAGERADVKAVFLDIDSPGGTVAGTPELAAAVASLDKTKPVYAFTSGLMCSAAYWIASQARAIYATPSAQVGSIGVVQAVVDDSAALAAEGIKVEVFAAGKYKAIGAPGTSLTDEQRSLIQANIAETAAEFRAAVLARGRAIPHDAMEGQAFSGRNAQRMNLAGMVPDRAEAMRRLRVYHASVDTAIGAMSNKAIEDQLAEARAQLDSMQQDAQAQGDLLNEASASLEALRLKHDALAIELESARAERDESVAEARALQNRIYDLEAAKDDFDAKVQAEVARVVASTGTLQPAAVTPAGDAALAEELKSRFAAISDPAEQTAFWRSLTPEQKGRILKA